MSRKISYGGGHKFHEHARANFPGAGLRGYSLCTTPIEIPDPTDPDKILSRGSGFFYMYEGVPYLVSAWHVFSGRDVFSRQAMSPTGYEPRVFRYYDLEIKYEGERAFLTAKPHTIELTNEGIELFRSPPHVLDEPIDIAAIPLREDIGFHGRPDGSERDRNTRFINENAQGLMPTNAGDDCYVLGYPLSNYIGFRPPLWRKLSIATDTILPTENLPMFLLDGPTREGFSGGPVIRMSKALIEDSDRRFSFLEVETALFIGVYAGRLSGNAYGDDPQIAYAWYDVLIPEIIDLLYKGRGAAVSIHHAAGDEIDTANESIFSMDH